MCYMIVNHEVEIPLYSESESRIKNKCSQSFLRRIDSAATDPGMGRVCQLDVLLSVYLRILDRVVFLLGMTMGGSP